MKLGMSGWLALGVCVAILVGIGCSFLGGPAEAFSTEERILWTTSKIHGTPEPPSPYRPEVAFPNVQFYEPITIANVPGENKLIVGERFGKVYSFTPQRDADDKELMIDLKRVLYGIALHPRFEENGYVYMVTVPEMGTDLPKGSKLLRFKAETEAPYRVDAKSEKVLLEWRSGGHNGGCLRFGPDGYLYVVTGDASGIADEWITGQDISDLPASLLRIDVDKSSGGKGYSVPADNPFVGRRNVRPEIWAYGLRQLWKFSFDRESGRMWGGEIGQDLWESVYIIEKGGNYGWSVREGRHPFRPERPKGPTDFVDPVVDHSHTDFRSVTGGYVYYGDALPELKGAYIYGDYDTGRLWMLRYDGEKVTEQKELMDTQFRIIEFAQTDDGEVFFADFVSGNIYRPVPAPPPDSDAPAFPRRLE